MTLRRTPLFESHQSLGARLVDFGGWEMPVQYTSILKEHAAVRTAAGLFDVSHMGVFEVTGNDAEAALQALVPNNIARLKDHGGLYTQLCQADGGVIDDLLIFRWHAERYWLIVNAGNRQVDFDWVTQHLKSYASRLQSLADHTGILALQGPRAESLLQRLMDEQDLQSNTPLASLMPFHLTPVSGSVDFVVSRSGYTGEDGFELYVPYAHLVSLWTDLLKLGETNGLVPVGLGARDTLRLEAAMPLYGHELDRQTTPLEAGLGWSVKLGTEAKAQPDFIGKDALIAQNQNPLPRQRIGFIMPDSRRAPREGYPLFMEDTQVGVVTSGSLSPTLGYPIGMGYLKAPYYDQETPITLEIRGQRYPVERVTLPFYRRKS